MELGEISNQIREKVLLQMDMTTQMTDEEIESLIGIVISREFCDIKLSIKERIRLEQIVFNSLRKLDVLQELVDDKSVSEIMVNGPNHIFYEKDGIVYESKNHFASEEKMHDVIQQIVGRHNRVVNQSSPIVDTRLPDGSRVNIVLSPISIDGSSISIRKFPDKPLTMEQLIENGAITREAADLLKKLVKAKYSLFISGGTSSGKTTFLNALSEYIPKDERIITIEDSAELQIQGVRNLVRLETRNANMEGVTPITVRDLIKTALRMRPDRIIVGECRGAETLDMLQAMNTGHDGSLSTGHANSCRDILSRIEMMTLMAVELPLPAIRQQIVSGIDIIVQPGRRSDRTRCVVEIAEMNGIRNGEIVLSTLYLRKNDALISMGQLRHRDKLIAAGVEL